MLGLILLPAVSGTLTVENTSFAWDGKPVFLSGVNLAWLDYGNDFGNNQTHGKFCTLREALQNTSGAGGHAERVWLHIEGDNTPQWSDDGFVVGTDAASSLIPEMQAYLREAAEVNVLVFFVLWNGAVLRNEKTKGLFSSASKLQSYINKVLTPMAAALADEPALGGWEIINEPEGSVAAGVADEDPCFDTMALKGTGAGWAQSTPIPMKQVLTFVATQAAAIHKAAPGALVSVGSWSEHSVSDELGLKDYYTTPCLHKAAGGDTDARLDFQQMHSYPTAAGNHWNPTSPFEHQAKTYGLTKPLVVGEFPATGDGLSTVDMYRWTHDHGYSGGWGWTEESAPSLYGGMASLRMRADVKAVALPHKGLPNTCGCSDKPPPGGYTCAQQASWGKCGDAWMVGYCCRSCFACSATCAAAHTDEAAATVGAAVAAKSAPLQRWTTREYRRAVEAARARRVAA